MKHKRLILSNPFSGVINVCKQRRTGEGESQKCLDLGGTVLIVPLSHRRQIIHNVRVSNYVRIVVFVDCLLNGLEIFVEIRICERPNDLCCESQMTHFFKLFYLGNYYM